MEKKIFTFCLAFLFTTQLIYSQTLCDNASPFNSCTPLPYTYNTVNGVISNGAITTALSNSTCTASIENNQFYSFVASTTSMSITIDPGTVTGGLQAWLFSTTDCITPNVLACNSNGFTTPTALTSNSLVIGQQYFIMIDGFAGATGTYSFASFSTAPAGTFPVTFANIPATCGLSDGSITMTATGGKAPYQYSIDSGKTYFSSNTFPNIPSGVYDVFVKDANGCTTITKDTLTFIQITASADQVYCSVGGPVTISAQGGTLFHWTPSAGIVSSNIDSSVIQVAPATSTFYIVTSNIPVGVGCKTADTVYVVRVPDFSSNLTLDEDTICLNGTATLTAHAFPDSLGPFTYAWTPASSIINQLDSNVTVMPAVSTTYVVQITSAGGCVVVKDSTRVVVNGRGPTITLTSDKDYVCPGDTITITPKINITTVNCGLTPGGSGSACPGGSSFTSQKIGSGTTSGDVVTPYQGYWTNARVQYLFKASELTARGLTAGTITDLTFLITSKASTQDYTDFTVKMGCTNLTQLTTNFVGGLQTVVNPLPYTSYVGANPHVFDNPYDWDGYSNLIVEVCFFNGVSNYTDWDDVEYTANVFPGATVYYHSDQNPACPNLTGTVSADRPNVTFGMCNPPLIGYNFDWTQLLGSSPLTCTSCFNPKVGLLDDGLYKLQVIDPNGCKGEAFTNLHVNQSTAITAGSDTSICSSGAQLNVVQTHPQPITCVPNYSIQAVPYSAILPTGATTNIPSNDQVISGMLPIGFNFDFYCNTYSTFAASGNGFITFLTGQPYADFSSTIPTAGTPNGLVALCWDDLDPAPGTGGGLLDYFVSGTAPNRVLVVRYNNVQHWNSANVVNGEIHLYETTNVIEIMTQTQNDGGTHAQGIENANGSSGVAVPGRNSQSWSISAPDGYKFTPQYSGVAIVGYNWTPASGLSATNIANPIATPTTSTCYTAEVTYTNGCVVRDTVCVNKGTFPHSVSVVPDTICAGDTAQLNFTGAAVTYAWTPSANVTNAAIANPKATASNTTIIYISATNTQGCSTLDSVKLNVRPYTPVILRSDTSVCPGGSLSLTVPGGPYTSYEWYSLATGNTIISTSASITALPVNDYYVKVQKPGICPVFSDTFTLTEYTLGTVSTSGDTSICNGASLILNASASVSNILWSTTATTSSITVSTAGDYFYSGLDVHGCLLNSDTTTVTVVAPPVINFAPVANPVCPYDVAILDAGSLTGITYTWNPGAINAPTLTVTSSGTYDVTANNNGCSTTGSITVNFAPAATVTLPAADQTVCPGDSFLIPVTGGTFSIYEWHSASTGAIVQTGNTFFGKPVDSFYVKVSDANGCVFTSDTFAVSKYILNALPAPKDTAICTGASFVFDAALGVTNILWSNGAITPSITVSTAGDYFYSAQDSHGCLLNSDTTTLTVVAPPVITFAPVANPVCPYDVAILDAGSLTGVTYTWNPGGIKTPTLTVTTSGTYDVTANANGCSTTGSITVNFATAPTVTLPAADQTVCPGDSFLIPVSGGAFSNFEWHSASTGAIVISATPFYGKPIDSFYVKVSDANGCVFTSDTFAVYQKTVPQLLPLGNHPLCQGSSVTLLGTAGLTGVVWSPNGETTQDITVSTSGQYSYTALANGCPLSSDVANVTVTPIPVITFNNFKNPICSGDTVAINAGDEPGVTYSWSTGIKADTIQSTGGLVSVIAENNGCTATLSTTVNVASSPIITLPANVDVCACSIDTVVKATVSTLATPVNYQWSGGASLADTLHVKASGVYTVTATDANGCSSSATYSANAWCLKIGINVEGQTINLGQTSQLDAVVLNTSNYTPSLTYIWHPGASLTDSLIKAPKATPTTTTTYIVYVADKTHNCSAFDTVTIGVIPPGLYAIPTGFTPNGDGQNDYFYPFFSPGSTATVVSMRIYNRWGQLIYNGPSSPGWDGKVNGVDAPVDTYTYYLELTVPDVNNPSGTTTIIKAGSFAIIR